MDDLYTIENREIAIHETAYDEEDAYDEATGLAVMYRGKKFRIFYAGQLAATVWWENGKIEIRHPEQPMATATYRGHRYVRQ